VELEQIILDLQEPGGTLAGITTELTGRRSRLQCLERRRLRKLEGRVRERA
jgi:hypothetical protein